MNELTHLDLFSGIGGFALAAKWAGFRTIGFCEIDEYCQKIIAKNFLADASGNGSSRPERNESDSTQSSWRDAVWSGAEGCCRILSDIRNLDGRDFAGVTLITGGFPCQPFSVAGKRRGKEDDRHLWPEMLRVIDEARPAWVLGENVTGIIGMELDQVLSDLEGIGYATRTFVIPACGVDAPHRRNRVWIVAYCSESRLEGQFGPEHQGGRNGFADSGQDVADADEQGSQGHGRLRERGGEWPFGPCSWPDEGEWFAQSGMGRVAHGIPKRVDRLRGLGNAIVPQVALQILKAIAEIELTSVTRNVTN